MDTSRDHGNLYWMLLQVAFRTRHSLTKMADAKGLSLAQMQAICMMTPREPIAMNTISCFLACDKSNVTGIVDRLLHRGYIVREEKPEDRRIKMISLTLKGEKIRAELFEELATYELPEFARLTKNQQSQLLSILEVILRSPL